MPPKFLKCVEDSVTPSVAETKINRSCGALVKQRCLSGWTPLDSTGCERPLLYQKANMRAALARALALPLPLSTAAAFNSHLGSGPGLILHLKADHLMEVQH